MRTEGSGGWLAALFALAPLAVMVWAVHATSGVGFA